MAKEALYKQTRDRDSDSIPNILENKLIMDLKQSLIQLEAQYMKLAETYKPEYPEMVRIRSQMEAEFGPTTALEQGMALGLFAFGKLREQRTLLFGDDIQPYTRVFHYG
jgi:hypothetical protein